MVLLLSCVNQATVQKKISRGSYFPSTTCMNCHERAYKQHLDSMHAISFSNEAFQSQYFNEVVPQSLLDPHVEKDAAKCLACHNPIAYLTQAQPILSREMGELAENDVTCDFCHTITGYSGDSPGNANYIVSPGEYKYGPHRTETQWHHRYNRLFTSSHFCGICHNGTNHMGTVTKSTFTEWQKSPYAKKNIQCQDCHMNMIGFIEEGGPLFESGRAAQIGMSKPPRRKNLHTHTFPGSSSKNQMIGSIKLKIFTDRTIASPGETVDTTVFVDNRRTGHKMPTGHTEWRLIWLELVLNYEESHTHLQAEPGSGGDIIYDVAGRCDDDTMVLGDDIPEGSRIYRQVFHDSSGKLTLASYEAARTVFDNRLDAAEMRKEKYSIKVPETKGTVYITAKLYYLVYPDSVARRLDIKPAEKIELATASREIVVE